MKPWSLALAIAWILACAPAARARPPRSVPALAGPGLGTSGQVGSVTLEASGASLKDILRSIARQGRIGLIMASDVPDRKIDVILHDVPAAEALEAAAMAGGLVWHNFGTLFVVWAPKPPLLSLPATP